jgi:hypothetical protein
VPREDRCRRGDLGGVSRLAEVLDLPGSMAGSVASGDSLAQIRSRSLISRSFSRALSSLAMSE